ncbi:MAG: response regulator [Myxococcota bacterium]|nr:response regulator [Myxococcota bacterium]
MSELKRILFVDDDPGVLSGLQNVLHRDRRRWDMTFALGGEVALEHLRTQRYDVVVSDMRMPVVDGAELFALLRREAPGTARIMLSGSDCETAMPDVDELLPKPCSASILRTAIERALGTAGPGRSGELRAMEGACPSNVSTPSSSELAPAGIPPRSGSVS